MCSLKVYAIIIHTTATIINNGLAIRMQEDNSYWQQLGANDIKRALAVEPIVKTAKNVILFLGDGMGLTTVTASRIYSKGEDGYLSFEKFPHVGVLKTYSADKLVPDSCSTATALFCGVKANYRTSGVDSSVTVDDCEASLKPKAQLDSILTWAQNAGKSTGFVTTTRVTHATPSALYAHTPNRKWECESVIPKNAKKCKDIARQLIEDEPGKSVNVIMGGGRQCLQSEVGDSESDPVDTWSCYSSDGRDLIRDWKEDKTKRKLTHSVVTNSGKLEDLDPKTQFVLGIFANGHLKMDYDRDRSRTGMPSLANMTQKAIQVLNNNPQGYVLVVEGGLIDFAHHRGHAKQALDETARFSDAIDLALNTVSELETLIIVTSDHSHSMVLTGYASREKSVLDIAQQSKIDLVPYTSLLYATGGPNNYQYSVSSDGKVSRLDPSTNDTRSFEYSQQAAVLTDEVTHSGTDVLVYAKGPMSHLFHSVHEQTFVAYVVSYAAKIGPYMDLTSRAAVTSISKIFYLCFSVMYLFSSVVVA